MSLDLVDQRASDLAPSLDLYAISLPNEGGEKLLRCPRKEDWRWQHEETGEIRPARCRANFCPWCGPVNASLVAGAISLAGVERFGTLTQVGNDWQTMRARMFRLAYDVRKRRELHWAWHIEPNPKGTGHHAHFFQRGDFIPQQELSRLADNRGMGRVADIRKWEAKGKGKAGYGLKLAGVGYGLKQAQAEATMKTYLGVNGGRLVHTTRGFWRDLDGQAVSQREAMVAWARRAGTEDDGKWQLVRVA